MKKILVIIAICALFVSCSSREETTYKVVPYACSPNSNCLTYFNNVKGQITCYVTNTETGEISPLTLNQGNLKQVLCDSVTPYIKICKIIGSPYEVTYTYIWYSKNELSPFGPIFSVTPTDTTKVTNPSNQNSK